MIIIIITYLSDFSKACENFDQSFQNASEFNGLESKSHSSIKHVFV